MFFESISAKVTAIADVNFEVFDGEFFCLIGPPAVGNQPF